MDKYCYGRRADYSVVSPCPNTKRKQRTPITKEQKTEAKQLTDIVLLHVRKSRIIYRIYMKKS
jgi:hypothetical protein